MTNLQVSGIEPGQRRLNGTQTTGREYRNLSQPTHGMAHDDEAAVPRRNGVMLLADVYRPAEPDLWKPTPGRPRRRLGVPSLAAGHLRCLFSNFRRVNDEFEWVCILVFLHQFEIDEPFGVSHRFTAVEPSRRRFQQRSR